MMPLLDRTRDFDRKPYRNIVSLRESQDLFDDLTDGDASMGAIAVEAESRVKSHIPLGLVERGFHYTTSITCPFDHEPYLKTRYGNGTFGVWYGSLALKTTIHETAFHMVREESGIEGNRGPVYRERAVYRVRCKALLIDLSGKEAEFPYLVGPDYGFTRQVGERLHREGHPGLPAPSARHRGGINLVSLSPAILSDPALFCYLSYTCDPARRVVPVERTPGKVTAVLKF